MAEKDFLVISSGAELPQFERPTYCIFLPDKKLLDDENIKSALAKLAPLVHAGEPQIQIVESSTDGATELTCMDAREFSVASRLQLRGQNFLTFAGSGFFLHPSISTKLREAGHSDLVDALAAILRSAHEKGLEIKILSNHFGEDGGCGGLNFFKTIDPNFELPTAADYKKLLVETRTAVPEIADDAQILMYETGEDHAIKKVYDLENDADFAAFAAKYEGRF